MPAFGDLIVYLEYHPLPQSCQPALVERLNSRTLVWIDGRATCLDVLMWSQEYLTVSERGYIRAACGCPPIGQHLPDDQVTDRPCGEVWPEVPVLQAPHRLLRSA